MSMEEKNVIALEAWPGDVLARKAYADFLTHYLVSKTQNEDGQASKSFTLALDAQWGQGKTFFITNWARDLCSGSSPYPTLIFDAWAADYGQEPMVSFMAAFKEAIDTRIDGLELKKTVKSKASKHLSRAVSQFRHALVPASKIVGKGILQKLTGVAFDEILDAAQSDRSTGRSEHLRGDILEVMNKGLDEFFEKSLEEHVEREQAIEAFKESIEKALLELSESGGVALPMFVFIDELDRCRPDFAIELLEGVKHLFGIPGVCFVVSTNISQLSESTKAIYGSGFDGYNYLKRFFDVEYTLPAASGTNFMRLLLKENSGLKFDQLVLGLPKNGFDGINDPMDACYALTWVTEVFALDLRSQRTVLEMVVASASGVPSGKKIFVLWLAILCAIKYKSLEAFEMLAATRQITANVFHDVWDKVTVPEVGKTVRIRSHGGYGDTKKVVLRDIALAYYGILHKDLKDVLRDESNVNIYDYPESVTHPIRDEMPSTFFDRMSYPPSIRSYFHLVRTAGHLVAF
jgi:hypothetical protein